MASVIAEPACASRRPDPPVLRHYPMMFRDPASTDRVAGEKKLDSSRSRPRIHEASVRILENTGIWLDNEEADDLLFCAEKEIPFLWAAGANIGSSAPGTPGALA